jgi:hypothetical protein
MNYETAMSLDEAVAEVLGLLTGLDLSYEPELDRYRSITRQINRGLRTNALDNEWSCYNTLADLGTALPGEFMVRVPSSLRVRVVNDDALLLVDPIDEEVRGWAYFLPRDALHKYRNREELRASFVGNTIHLSRPFGTAEAGYMIRVPAMREPRMLRLPPKGVPVPPRISKQLIDFPYPDAITSRAAYFYAQTDPVMQPRAQTLEGAYKDIMYQLIERDTAHNDDPYINEFILPVESGLRSQSDWRPHTHPHSAG